MSTRTGVLSPRVDHRHQQSQLRLLRRLLSPIAGRYQKPTHLGDRVPAQSEHPRRVPPAVPLQAVHTGEPPPHIPPPGTPPATLSESRRAQSFRVADFYAATRGAPNRFRKILNGVQKSIAVCLIDGQGFSAHQSSLRTGSLSLRRNP